MDTRKLDIIIGLYDEPVIVDKSSDNGDEVARIYTTGDDDFDNTDRIPFGTELVRRWNAYPELVALAERVLGHIQSAIDEDDDDYLLDLKTCNECGPDAIRELLQTLKA